MEGLLTLLNRAASYFNKPNNEINNTDCERSDVCCMMILASIYALLADGLLLLKIIISNAKDATIAARKRKIKKSNVLLVMNSNISDYMKLVQMSNANIARMRGAKLTNTAIHASVLHNGGGAGDITLNRKKHLRNMTS
jgi:hypothetical protein